MTDIRFIFKWLQLAGFQQIPRIVIYTFQRNWRNRENIRKKKQLRNQPWQTPGKLAGAESTINGARFRFEKANLNIDFLASEVVRVHWEPGKPSYPYAIEKSTWPKTRGTLTENENGFRLHSDSIQIQIMVDGGLEFHGNAAELLRGESPPERQEFDDEITWRSHLRLRPEECIYGLGEQTGALNLRGSTHRIWNTDPKGGVKPGTDPVYMPLPVYMSLHRNGSSLVFYENSFPAIFNLAGHLEGNEDSCEIIFEGGPLRYYFILGKPADILRLFTRLTGRSELPPKWSLGYHHSRWGFKNEKDVRDVVQGFIKHDMPVSAIHLDIDHMDGYRTFTVDQVRFPDLKRLADDLDPLGIKLISIVNPRIVRDSSFAVYHEGERGNHFVTFRNSEQVKGIVWPGWCVYPDFTDLKTRNWWKSKYQSLISANIAGFWHDMNEPTSFSLSKDMDLPLESHHKMEGAGGNHRQAHNLYALLMNRAGYEAMREYRPQKRPWLLSRSGWVSQQRYGWNWTGDTETSWQAMRMTISTVLGLGLCGISYTGPDIGGFSGNPDGELYLRWFQMASFLPFFRTHSAITTLRREPWSYGEPYTGIIRDFINLRYRLMPFWYSLAWQTSQTGVPLVRPLFWIDPLDQNLWESDSSFILGDSLLIAPVLRQNSSVLQIQIPKGKWYSWWNEAEFEGPGTIEHPITLDKIPLLVRAGSLLPLEEKGNLHLHIYPSETEGPSNPFVLYNDSGDGYGISRLDRFRVERVSDGINIEWTGEGEFPFPYGTVTVVLHGWQGRYAVIDGQSKEIDHNHIQTKRFSSLIIK